MRNCLSCRRLGIVDYNNEPATRIEPSPNLFGPLSFLPVQYNQAITQASILSYPGSTLKPDDIRKAPTKLN